MAWGSPRNRQSPSSKRLTAFVKSLTKSKKHASPPEPTPEPTQDREVKTSPVQVPRPSISDVPLTVDVALEFEIPAQLSYAHQYRSSKRLIVSDGLYRGLLERIDHCSQELITRKDPDALESTALDGSSKKLAFQLSYTIARSNDKSSETRTFKSYPDQPCTVEAVIELVHAANRIVGLFLRQNDPGFKWKGGPLAEDFSRAQNASPYRFGGPQSLLCIPRARSHRLSQVADALPGYTIIVSLQSHSQSRTPSLWECSLAVPSNQPTPLNLALAEHIFFESASALDDAIKIRRRIAETVLSSAGWIDRAEAQQESEDGVKVTLQVANNFGPRFAHLEKLVHVKSALFTHLQAEDCDELAWELDLALRNIRDKTDTIVSNMNDMEIRITKVDGKDWVGEEPLVFNLGPSTFSSRRRIEVLLDRIQSTVAHKLRGYDATVQLAVWKRGHCIMDKTMNSANTAQKQSIELQPEDTTSESLVERLRTAVQQGIDMVCRDTCTLKDASPVGDSAQATLEEIQTVNANDETISQNITRESSCVRAIERLPGLARSQTEDTSQEPESELEEENTQEAQEPKRPDESNSRPVIRDPITGARIFPLVPPHDSGERPVDLLDEDGSEQTGEKAEQDSNLVTRDDKVSCTDVIGADEECAGHSQTSVSESAMPSIDETEHVEGSQSGDESWTAPSTPSLASADIATPQSKLVVTPTFVRSRSVVEARISHPLDDDGHSDHELLDSIPNQTPVRSFKQLIEEAKMINVPDSGPIPVTTEVVLPPDSPVLKPEDKARSSEQLDSSSRVELPAQPEESEPPMAEQVEDTSKPLLFELSGTGVPKPEQHLPMSVDDSAASVVRPDSQPSADHVLSIDKEAAPDSARPRAGEIPEPISVPSSATEQQDSINELPATPGHQKAGNSVPMAIQEQTFASTTDALVQGDIAQSKPIFELATSPPDSPALSATTENVPDMLLKEFQPLNQSSGVGMLSDMQKRPSFHVQRRSLGSAGYLGFHEERLVEVGLRRALIGTVPRRPNMESKDQTPARPRTSGEVLDFGEPNGGVPAARRNSSASRLMALFTGAPLPPKATPSAG